MTEPVRKYQPSNGTEGDCFMSEWCCKCARDRSMREGEPIDECDDNERCDIIVKTYAYKVTDPEYPVEWQYRDGVPVCTAYLYPDDELPRPRCEKTVDMFSEAQP